MKLLLPFLILVLMFGCQPKSTDDCLRTAGKTVSKNFNVKPFSKIMMGNRTRLFLKQGDSLEVKVKTGENLLSQVDAYVDEDRLFLKNGNNCNLVRDYGLVKFYVTTPQLTEIKNGSQFDVKSQNELKFPKLTLISDDRGQEDEFHTDGDFHIQIDNQELTIINSNLSNYFLSGKTSNLDIQMLTGDSRIEAQHLIAKNIKIFHRGTQEILVHPLNSLKGSLVSTGDLIAVHRPTFIAIEEKYKGKFRIKE